MATILSFHGKKDDSSAQDFLTDETEKLSFCTADDGAVSLGDVTDASLPDILPDPKRDWGNQELADLFRVKQLLSGANVPVETMRGVTDEGDPWSKGTRLAALVRKLPTLLILDGLERKGR